ncbi:MAG: hypothetical protein K2L82_18360 [Lachnospiraceae bacterium]|nr:hypothetical protein [Lachnospiraceae bacterium]
MSRKHKITIVVFCMGVLLCGIGVGIAFTEFSGLTYGGTEIVGETDMRTANLDVEFEPEEEVWNIMGTRSWHSGHYGGVNDMGIQTDSSVPVNTVRISVTYNANRVEPFTSLDIDSAEIYLGWYWNDTDELALMMEAKDKVLQNLKNGRLISFDVVNMEQVDVFVNPQNVEDVRLIY